MKQETFVTILCFLQASRRVDFSANPLADLSFDFYDSALLDEACYMSNKFVFDIYLLFLTYKINSLGQRGKRRLGGVLPAARALPHRHARGGEREARLPGRDAI